MHLVPVVSREYVSRFGLPKPQNLHEHQFIQSALYESDHPLWQPWKGLVARGRVAHYSENSFTYGMMVKAGLGIGLLGSYTVLEPAALPLELGVHIPLRLHASVLSNGSNRVPSTSPSSGFVTSSAPTISGSRTNCR